MELTCTPRASRYRLLRHLRTAGGPVRAEALAVEHGPTTRAALDDDLQFLHERGLIEETPGGWLWRD